MQQQALALPIKKQLTHAEWLRHSIGWTLACVAVWYLVTTALEMLFGTHGAWFGTTLLGAAAAAHLLIWYQAVWSSRHTVTDATEPFWLSIVSACWLLGLILFQLACLALAFLFLLIGANGGIMG